MKKLFTLAFCLVLASSLVVGASASESLPFEQEQPNAGYIITQDNFISPTRMGDITQLVGQVTLTGLNPDRYYRYEYGTAGYDFPKRVGQVSTNLTTTGYGTTIKTGFATVNWGSGTTNPVAYSYQNLSSNAYKYFNSYSTSTTYYPFVTNETGGVVRGTVNWYSIID